MDRRIGSAFGSRSDDPRVLTRPAPHPVARCRACSAVLAGPFCQKCGQPSAAVRRTLREVLSGQNGRLIHTLRIILTAPGELAHEIDEGRDSASMRPLTLLFHLAAFFFLVSTFTGFGIDVITRADASGTFATTIERNASAYPPALYHERLEHRFQAIYTVFVPLIALGYGGTIGLTHWRRKPWMVPLAGGIQYLCFIYLLLAVLWTAARAFGMDPFKLSPGQIVIVLVGVGYATLTHRRICQERWTMATLKGVVVVVLGAAVHNAALVAALSLALVVT